MTTYGNEPVLLKLRGLGRQKSRRYLECDDRRIKQDIQAFNERRNAKKRFEKKLEKCEIRKAKSDSLITLMETSKVDQSNEETTSAKIPKLPGKGRIAWSCLETGDTSIEIPTEKENSPLKSVFKGENLKDIDVTVSRKSMTQLVGYEEGWSCFMTNSNTSPPFTSINISQFLKNDCGKNLAPFFIIIKQAKETSQYSVAPTDADVQIQISLKTEDEKLQSNCTNFIQEKYASGDFTAVCEITDIVKDVMEFTKQNSLQAEKKINAVKSYQATFLQSLLSEFGLQNKTLTPNDIEGLMFDKTMVTSQDPEDFMFDDEDDFVHIVPPPRQCEGCLNDISGNAAQPLALNPCFHWFCDNCWISHIRKYGVPGDILCPATNCSCKVDDITLMALLPGKEYWNLKFKQMDNYIQKNRRLSWCPNKSCGKAAKVLYSIR